MKVICPIPSIIKVELSLNKVVNGFLLCFRDMPIAAFVSLITVIAIYLSINVAYFTMLSPQEFLLSDAVATVSSVLTFSQ